MSSHGDTIRDADPKLLRELADAVDKDRGHGKSLLTLTMRQAADDLDALLAENQQLRDALDAVKGEVHLWRCGELDTRSALEAVAAALAAVRVEEA